MSDETADRGKYERSDIAPKQAYLALGGVFLGIAAAIGIFWVMLRLVVPSRPPPHPTALETTRLVPPAPRLETHPREDGVSVRTAARARISGYGWVDAGHSLARVPIERAMALAAKRGWADPPEQTR